MDAPPERTVTGLLADWCHGDAEAGQRLMPLVYAQMEQLARRELRHERAGHTLQSRDLVHEACERLIQADVSWSDRTHFFAMAARIMRRVLVDHARAKRARKRGSGRTLLSLDALDSAGEPAAQHSDPFDLLMIDEVLTRLGRIDPRLERVVELYFFAGMTHQEVAAATGSSRATVQRDLRFARAWLRTELGG